MSDIIYTPPASSGGGQNPTTNFIPLNNGTSSFVDSDIYNNKNNGFLQSQLLGLQLGFNFDANTNQYIIGQYGDVLGLFIDNFNGIYSLGDIGVNSSFITYNTSNGIFKSVYGGIDIGLALNFAVNQFFLGDFNGSNASLIVGQSYIGGIYQGNDLGLGIDYANSLSQLGDFSFSVNGTYLSVDYNNQFIKTKNQGNDIGLQIDFANNLYQIGDYNLLHNGTSIILDDQTGKMTFNADNLNFPSSNLIDGATVIPVYKNLILTINGGTYRIPLYV